MAHRLWAMLKISPFSNNDEFQTKMTVQLLIRRLTVIFLSGPFVDEWMNTVWLIPITNETVILIMIQERSKNVCSEFLLNPAVCHWNIKEPKQNLKCTSKGLKTFLCGGFGETWNSQLRKNLEAKKFGLIKISVELIWISIVTFQNLGKNGIFN